MGLQGKKDPAPPGTGIWLGVTLLWGTVFYFTSVVMLRLASGRLEEGVFNPAGSDIFTIYGFHVVVLLAFAILAMMIKKQLDPKAEKQVQRKKAIVEGKGERVFVSFAGSIATSFFFTALTAGTFLVAGGLVGPGFQLSIPVVILAGVFNIAAGLCASLLVGLIFLIARVGRK
ncbi:hypothetical protein [Chlorobium phaeobacteroides]|jgi:hypothetical protein|uniref:Uncharacterized protein n=1 Tax=Chlorobium phaeobacteroides (strain DSM 266 / SMG 266 / 2430) TaxID=290317 RepID=A1BHW9_CHLPD|nr:hypothetical protein [Chlorobium phaeobacteroides]ABL65996.1 conserved hypothetical protein [Chlorobium phaeobacteroides DSM 266]MBV5328565.1 hypothetical protein [Chlorobium sp.]